MRTRFDWRTLPRGALIQTEMHAADELNRSTMNLRHQKVQVMELLELEIESLVLMMMCDWISSRRYLRMYHR